MLRYGGIFVAVRTLLKGAPEMRPRDHPSSPVGLKIMLRSITLLLIQWLEFVRAACHRRYTDGIWARTLLSCEGAINVRIKKEFCWPKPAPGFAEVLVAGSFARCM